MAFAVPGLTPLTSFFEKLSLTGTGSVPQAQAQAVASPAADASEEVATAKVEIYSRRFCANSMRTKGLFDRKNVPYNEYLIDNDHINNTAMLQRSQGRTTTPQVFVNGRCIGGLEEVMGLEQAGELNYMLGLKA